MQPSLFSDPATEASPLCIYDGPCSRHGRAELGPERHVSPTCINRDIRCLTCGRTGVESQNLAVNASRRTSGKRGSHE
jgi:hypothetical protein